MNQARILSRRAFMETASLGCVAMSAAGCASSPREGAAVGAVSGAFAIDGSHVRFFCPSIREPFKIMVIGDTHLFMDDDRGAPFTTYSGRMAKAYNQTRHFKTSAVTNPAESFENALAAAKESRVDLLALVGDIFSFPSEAAIEWAHTKLIQAGVPYLYVSGNHDWHYEGMAGDSAPLRAEWTEKRLKPLYQGRDPLMAAVEVKGVRFIAIDDSTYEILPGQLAFFREQVASGLPLAVLMHIPLYAPGRDVGFGCGHPGWGAQSDRNWQIERRPKWPETGHTAMTLAFRKEVFEASNLLGVFAGHTHQQSLDCVNGIPQIVAAANAAGGALTVEFCVG